MNDLLTAEEFAASRYDLPENGRRTELHAGRVVQLPTLDVPHGNAILNLSKAFAAHFAKLGFDATAYACYDLGLITARSPDSALFPAISCFTGGARFAESDKIVTTTRPVLVVEVPPTPVRLRELPQRMAQFLDWGVNLCWGLDPIAKKVHIFSAEGDHSTLSEGERLTLTSSHAEFAGLSISVKELYAEPTWWR